MSIEDYENNKAKYLKLKTSLNNICNNLRDFKGNVDDIKVKIMNNYSIDNDNPPVLNRIIKLSNNSNEIKNYLIVTVIPAIDAALKDCGTGVFFEKE